MLSEWESATADPSFWADNDRAQVILREQATTKKLIDQIDQATNIWQEARELYEMAREESDEDAIVSAWASLGKVDEQVAKLEFRRMLGGAHDPDPAVLSINAGAGGVDSQDWTEMLMRMYQRWAERHGFEVSVLDVQDGEQAGLRSVDMAITGEYAYGWLRSEIGVHRLVRISPFDANARRQTSFASVMVVPDFGEQKIDIEVNPSDLRVDKYRSSGAGGQHVNKTESAVRLTHLPTGIVVACQAERSQHKNMDRAMSVLKARLWEVEEQKRSQQMTALEGDKKKIEWGSQVRSYVIHPYQQVNDHRTEIKQGNVEAVLDGDLDSLMEGFLLMSGGGKRKAEDE